MADAISATNRRIIRFPDLDDHKALEKYPGLKTRPHQERSTEHEKPRGSLEGNCEQGGQHGRVQKGRQPRKGVNMKNVIADLRASRHGARYKATHPDE
jgi:hypothetical protein